MAIEMVQDGNILAAHGDTYYVKEQLKALGAKWNHILRVWVMPTMTEDAASAMAAHLSQEATKAKKELARKSLENAKSILSGKNSWICCEQCKVSNWERRHTECSTHGFRVRGVIYTGD
jgi:hypothetical protein